MGEKLMLWQLMVNQTVIMLCLLEENGANISKRLLLGAIEESKKILKEMNNE